MIGLLGSLLGGRGGRMLGGMIGGRNGAMIGGLLGSLLGARRLGGALGGIKSKFTGGDSEASDLGDEDAAMLIRVMVNAAKADGTIDRSEQEAIMGQLGDVSSDEREFLQAELAAPAMSPAELGASIPRNLAVEAYAVSLTAITVDHESERSYLIDLAEAMGVDSATRDSIHTELDLPTL